MTQENSEGFITVNVNDRDMVVPANTTILQSLTQAGVEIPSLCNDVRLKRSNGSCGLCVVEVGTAQEPDDAPRDVKACLTPITDGMVIKTHTDRLEEYRKVRLEQLLCDHNADCVAACALTLARPRAGATWLTSPLPLTPLSALQRIGTWPASSRGAPTLPMPLGSG